MRNKILTIIFFFTFTLLSTVSVHAAPTAVKVTPKGGTPDVDVYEYTSACIKFLSGERQTIILNNKVSNPTTALFFQHGDNKWYTNGFCSDLKACSMINDQAKDYIFIGFSMPASYNGAGGPWAEGYDFPCYYKEVNEVLQSVGKKLPNNTIFASYSRGGQAIKNTLVRNQIPSNVSLVKTIFLDSCFGGQCETIIKMPTSKRGAMLVYTSTVNDDNKNASKNESATKDLLSISQDNIYIASIKGSHGDVPRNCIWDFLLNKQCNGTVISSAGAAGNLKGLGGFAPSSTDYIATGSGGGTGGGSSGTGGWGGMTLKQMSDEEILKMVTKPSIKIEIPGVNFSEPKIGQENGLKFAYFPFLSEYIGAVYQYAVAVSSAIAVCVIIFYGFMIAFSGGSSDKIGTAKTRIGQALIGLVIAVSSYTILYTINPELVKLKNLKVYIIDNVTLNTWLPETFEGGFGTYSSAILGEGTVLGAPYQPPSGPPPGCGKKLTDIINTFLVQGPICVRSCNCAHTVSKVLQISGCLTSAQAKEANPPTESILDGSANSLYTKLKKAGWKDIEQGQPKPGDVIYFWQPKSQGASSDYSINNRGEKWDVTHVGIVYNATGQKSFFEAGTNMEACWGEKKKEIYEKCTYPPSDGKLLKGTAARSAVYKNSGNGGWRSQSVASYNQCVASLGVCPPTVTYMGEMCNYCNKLKKDIIGETIEGNTGCVSRQCLQISAFPGPSSKRKFGFLSNPN